ncbi:MAG: TolC family protein [Acidobacteria bacterium]|nr:MAG: TolC family protein [Acidobacteriota bacterium]REK01401.1 MAG: TolC family protein [Acidobacteriota bacterium]REK14357.1 MAG: TolC family protein [Acidobacteriota bacterium]REK45072.1 MAG: TolC family protein [Acidobacteriota bacterium]
MRSSHCFLITCATLFTVLAFGAFEASAQAPETQIARNTNGTDSPSAETDVAAPPVTEKVDPDAYKTIPGINNRRVGVNMTQTRSLSLSNAITLALQNNNDIEVTRNDVKIAEANLRSLLGFYDPMLSVSPNYTNQVTPQPSTLGGADLSGVTRSNEFRVNSSVFTPLKAGGGSFNVFFNNTRDETSNSFSQLNPTYSTSFGVTFTQPLWKDRSIDFNRRQIRIQRKVIAQSDADFRRRTIEIISQVQRAYWDLVFALRDQQNRQANLELTKENLRQIEARIQSGAAAPLQRAEVSTELANRESELLLATQQVSIAENSLKQLVLKDPNDSQWSESFVPTDQPVFNTDPINLDNVVSDAISNRPELQRLKLQSEINEIDIEFFKNQIAPQIDFNANYTMIGLSGTGTAPTESFTVPLISGDPATSSSAFLLNELRALNPDIVVPLVTIEPSVPPQFLGGYGQSLKNLFTNDTRSYSVGVTFSFPIGNKTAKANLAAARYQEERIAAQTRAQEQSVIAEVRNAVQAAETARERVLTARRARENAEIQLAGERKLYEVGRSTTFLLFQRENALTNARNAEIRAETDYNKALADLQKATSTTFRANNITVDSPTDDDGN